MHTSVSNAEYIPAWPFWILYSAGWRVQSAEMFFSMSWTCRMWSKDSHRLLCLGPRGTQGSLVDMRIVHPNQYADTSAFAKRQQATQAQRQVIAEVHCRRLNWASSINVEITLETSVAGMMFEILEDSPKLMCCPCVTHLCVVSGEGMELAGGGDNAWRQLWWHVYTGRNERSDEQCTLEEDVGVFKRAIFLLFFSDQKCEIIFAKCRNKLLVSCRIMGISHVIACSHTSGFCAPWKTELQFRARCRAAVQKCTIDLRNVSHAVLPPYHRFNAFQDPVSDLSDVCVRACLKCPPAVTHVVPLSTLNSAVFCRFVPWAYNPQLPAFCLRTSPVSSFAMEITTFCSLVSFGCALHFNDFEKFMKCTRCK